MPNIDPEIDYPSVTEYSGNGGLVGTMIVFAILAFIACGLAIAGYYQSDNKNPYREYYPIAGVISGTAFAICVAIAIYGASVAGQPGYYANEDCSGFFCTPDPDRYLGADYEFDPADQRLLAEQAAQQINQALPVVWQVDNPDNAAVSADRLLDAQGRLRNLAEGANVMTSLIDADALTWQDYRITISATSDTTVSVSLQIITDHGESYSPAPYRPEYIAALDH